jgi:3-hydroxyacyl-CoA dehydrogenase/enoyl-CoA hydratase/carnithine racemase
VSIVELEFPGETATRTFVRLVELPGGAGTAALLTLDNGLDHTRPNTFGPGGLRSLSAALDEVAARPDLAAVCLVGKPYGFAAGADLSGVPLLHSREQAHGVARGGRNVFRRLGELGVPTFAFVNGIALGGGLEIALHCSYRTVDAAVRALGLPECSLGLVPGWGGTQLLPPLVGADAAVRIVVEDSLDRARPLTAAQALELGVVDAMFSSADFLEQSLDWAARVLTGEVVVRRRDPDSAETWEAALARGRAAADAKVHGAAPAPYRALELLDLSRTASRDVGFAAEDEALADLLMSEELRAGLYAFDLVQRRARRPATAPDAALARPVAKVGVVGAGLMATQLALLFARRLEVPVVLTDIDEAALQRGVALAHAEIDALCAKGRVSRDTANRLTALVTGSTDLSAFADADLVIEAVYEDLGVKQRVFAQLETVVPSTCVLATNTSALSVGEIAGGLAHPERVVGLHFFNPVAVLPLVEVVRTAHTDDATLATAFAVAAALRKSAVLVRDAPGFVVNRVLTRLLGEVLAAVDAGTPIADVERSLAPLGLPMGPLALLQLVGPAVALHVAETLHAAFPDRFGVSACLRRLVETGELVPGAQPGEPPTAEKIRARALDALAEEIRCMLDDGVVAEPQDVDLCLLLGAGWPFHLGGITPYLDRTGVAEQVTGHRFLPAGVATLASAPAP